jgi:hypothetical protein
MCSFNHALIYTKLKKQSYIAHKNYKRSWFFLGPTSTFSSIIVIGAWNLKKNNQLLASTYKLCFAKAMSLIPMLEVYMAWGG